MSREQTWEQALWGVKRSAHIDVLDMGAADQRDVEQPRDARVVKADKGSIGFDPPHETPYKRTHLRQSRLSVMLWSTLCSMP